MTAFNVAPNFIPPSSGQLFSNLKNALKAAGWILVRVSNGSVASAYNAGGVTDTFDATLTGWFVLKQPAISGGNPGAPGGREFLFSSLGGVIATHYARFDTTGYQTGGGPTTLPTATHDVLLPNSSVTTGVYTLRQQVIAQTAAPYAWVSLIWLNGGADAGGIISQGTHLLFDYCSPAIAVDPEPYIVGAGLSSTNTAQSYSYIFIAQDLDTPLPTQPYYTWYGAGTVSEQFLNVSGCTWGCSFSTHLASPQNLGVNFWNGKDEEMPIFWSGDTTKSGLRHPKGTGTMMRWSGKQRALGTTLNSKAEIVVQDVIFDWDSASVPFI